MKDDTAAMNTARQSAVSTKLSPNGRSNLTVTVLPERTTGIRDAAAKNEANTAVIDTAFLNFVDIYPQSGAIKAPAIGIKTQDSNSISFVIFLSK